MYFKHLYGADLADWGVVAFPTSQPAGTALKRYVPNQRVLLAVPENEGDPELRGKIFGMCTLLRMAGKTEWYANPSLVSQMPDVVQRWGTVAPIHRYWCLKQPVAYSKFRPFARSARIGRGRLESISDHAVLCWADTADWIETSQVFRSRAVASILARQAA